MCFNVAVKMNVKTVVLGFGVENVLRDRDKCKYFFIRYDFITYNMGISVDTSKEIYAVRNVSLYKSAM